MNNAVYYVLVIVAGYFCGCIESGYLVGKLCGMDIRDYGAVIPVQQTYFAYLARPAHSLLS